MPEWSGWSACCWSSSRVLDAGVRQVAADAAEQARIGAAEAVDGLLRIAHHEQLARRRHGLAPVALRRIGGRQQQQDLGLQRIGILKLVDEDALVSLLQFGARAIVPQQVAGVEQQVHEIELAGALLWPAGRVPPLPTARRADARPGRHRRDWPNSSMAAFSSSQEASTASRETPSPYLPPPCLSHRMSRGRRRISLSTRSGSKRPASRARRTRSRNSASGRRPSYSGIALTARSDCAGRACSRPCRCSASSAASRSKSRLSQGASKSRHSASDQAA